MRVYTFGAPGQIGGASTELLHTIALWRANGVEVHCIPTWSIGHEAEAKLDQLGVPIHQTTAETFADVPGLAGSVIVSFCNADFLKAYGTLRKMGCRLCWCNCMNWMFMQEEIDFSAHGCPDAMMFQSEHQRKELESRIAGRFGYDPATAHVIRGAFDITDWPLATRPHAPGTDFVLGKLARPDADKWSSNLWPIYQRVQHPNRKALVMGLDENAAKKLGTLPEWANWLRPNGMRTQAYLAQIHCLLTVNGGAAENWPRVGLECFAAGVPVVAQRAWGWKEMIVEGETGYLGGCDEELAHWASVLAWDEPLRLRMIRRARERLVDELANPGVLWTAWERLFRSVDKKAVAA